MSYDSDDIIGLVWIGMRVVAFVLGLYLVFSGIADFGTIGETELIQAMSVTPIAFLKFIFGIFLVVAGLIPDAVTMIVEVVINR